MALILPIILAISSTISLGSGYCSSRRCGFKTHEISIPLKKIDFHICGDQIPVTLYDYCFRPKPPTVRPKTAKTKLRPTTQPLMTTKKTPGKPQSVVTSQESTKQPTTLPKGRIAHGNGSATPQRPTTAHPTGRPTTTSAKPTQGEVVKSNVSPSPVVMATVSVEGSKSNLSSGNSSLVANLTDASQTTAGNGAVVTTGAGVATQDRQGGHDDPPLVTTLNSETPISHEEANSFLTRGYANSPTQNFVEECCVEGCRREEVLEYCHYF